MRKNYLFVVLAILFTMNVMAQNIPSYVPKDGLVGYWPFNGNANDESGNGNHGTVNGATLSSDRNGVANSAYSFDGDNDFIELTSGANSNLNILGNVSINFWLKTEQLSTFAAITFGDNIGIDGGFLVDHIISDQNNNNPNKVSFWTKERWVASGTIWNDNISNLISITLESGVLKIYKNGKLEQYFFDQPGVSSYSGNRYFGKGSNSWGYLKGQLDDIAIYNRALSEQEVQQLYEGCTKETATSSSFNSLLLSTGSSVSLSAEPQGGVFSGASIENNQFIPSKAKIGSNKVKYNFKNSKGCADSTVFNMVVADTVGASCAKYDTVTITNNVTKYDTLKVTKFDTITVTNNVTKYDTVIVNKTKYDTITITNNVTKYDTIKVTKFDTITVTNNVTKYDTVKVNKYDTITITNKVTKYDTVLVNKTKYDTVIVKTNVFDTVKVTKYDTLTVKNNIYDTVSILKIKFKLTTGIHANHLSSISIYPNPTSDVLHIEVPDTKALEGYRYRILDALGKEVYNQLITQTTTEIPLKTLGAAGIYQFEILDATKTSIQSNKIVLQ